MQKNSLWLMTRLDLFEGLDTLQLSSIARGGRGGGVVMSLVSMPNVAKSILGCFTKCCNALTIIDTGNFFVLSSFVVIN